MEMKRKVLRHLSSTRSKTTILNDGEETAALAYDEIIKDSFSHVRLYESQLSKESEVNYALLISIMGYINEGYKFDYIVGGKESDILNAPKSPGTQFIFDHAELSNVRIKKADQKFKDDLNKVTHVNPVSGLLLGDKTKYRIQYNKTDVLGFVNFNDRHTNNLYASVYDTNFRRLEDLNIPK